MGRSGEEMVDVIEEIDKLSKKHGKYPPEAYVMVFEVLDFISLNADVKRHLTGKELALSAFVFSLQKYGLLARMVWEKLGMSSSEDLGQIVFHLVESKLLGKQEGDRVEDFDCLFTTKDFADSKVSLIGEREKWVHTNDKEKGLTLQILPPDKLGLNESKN